VFRLEKREEAGILVGMEHVNEHPGFCGADPVSHQRVDSAVACFNVASRVPGGSA